MKSDDPSPHIYTQPNGAGGRDASGRAARRRAPWPLAVVAALFIVVPFAFWYGTWFGRPLSDEKIGEYLRDEANPRRAQHALAQLAERIARGEEGVSRWYPQVVALGRSPVTDLRMTAAWVMGEDHRAEDFRRELLRLLDDPEPIVRRNTALALVRFGDDRGLAELRAMLRPYTVVSDGEGIVVTALTEATPVKRGSMLARLQTADGQAHELRSPLPGSVERALVRDGETVRRGAEAFVLGPETESVWEALRALYLVGRPEDLEAVEAYARGVEGMPERIRKQAALTADAIRRRHRVASEYKSGISAAGRAARRAG